MAGYVYIENDEIKEIHYFLPKNWRNISNFDSMNLENLKEVGWLPIIDNYQEYDPKKQRVTDTEIVYSNGEVNRIYVFMDNPIIEDIQTQPAQEEILPEEI